MDEPEISPITTREDVVEDGLYKGCVVRYASGLEIFYVYTPLMMTSVVAGESGIRPAMQGERQITLRDGSIQRFRDGYPVYEDMKR